MIAVSNFNVARVRKEGISNTEAVGAANLISYFCKLCWVVLGVQLKSRSRSRTSSLNRDEIINQHWDVCLVDCAGGSCSYFQEASCLIRVLIRRTEPSIIFLTDNIVVP